MRKLILTIAFSLTLMTGNASSQSSSSAIRLRLQTSKPVYRVGESLEIIAFLENVSAKSYYVGNTDISLFGSLGWHDMEVEFFDSEGKVVPIGRGGGTLFPKPNAPLAERLADAYVYLWPGMVHGLKEELEFPLKSGRYRLKATYREHYALTWTEAERKTLQAPVWTQPLVSNEVFIRVVRVQKKARFRRPSN